MYKQIPLKNILKLFNGYAFKKTDYKESGILLVRQTNLDGNSISKNKAVYVDEKFLEDKKEFILKEGDILIGMSGNIGKYCFFDLKEPALQNQRVGKLSFSDKVYSKFVLYYLPIIENQLKEKAKGVAVLNISGKDLEEIKIPLPSIPIQHLIVQEIEKQFSRLDEGLVSLKRTKENLKKYKASVLKSAVEGKLTEEWRKNQKGESAKDLLKQILQARKEKFLAENPGKKYKEPEGIKKEDLQNIKLPEGWEFASFPQLAEFGKNSIKAGPFGSSLKKEFYVEKGYKIYGQEQVISGDSHYGNYYIDEKRYNSLISCKVKPGDMLISLVGTIGKVLILPENIEEGIINPRLVKFSLDKNLVLSKYIEILLNSEVAKSFFKLFSHGGTMNILNLTILNKLPIPLPPLPEQNEIVKIVESKLSVVEKLEKIVNDNIHKAENLKQSILKKAFEGKLVK